MDAEVPRSESGSHADSMSESSVQGSPMSLPVALMRWLLGGGWAGFGWFRFRLVGDGRAEASEALHDHF